MQRRLNRSKKHLLQTCPILDQITQTSDCAAQFWQIFSVARNSFRPNKTKPIRRLNHQQNKANQKTSRSQTKPVTELSGHNLPCFHELARIDPVALPALLLHSYPRRQIAGHLPQTARRRQLRRINLRSAGLNENFNPTSRQILEPLRQQI